MEKSPPVVTFQSIFQKIDFICGNVFISQSTSTGSEFDYIKNAILIGISRWHFSFFGTIGKRDLSDSVRLSPCENPNIVIDLTFYELPLISLKLISSGKWKLSFNRTDKNFDSIEIRNRLRSFMIMVCSVVMLCDLDVFCDSDVAQMLRGYCNHQRKKYNKHFHSIIEMPSKGSKRYSDILEGCDVLHRGRSCIPIYHNYFLIDQFDQKNINRWLSRFLGKFGIEVYSMSSNGPIEQRISFMDINIYCEPLFSVYVSEISVESGSGHMGKVVRLSFKDHDHPQDQETKKRKSVQCEEEKVGRKRQKIEECQSIRNQPLITVMDKFIFCCTRLFFSVYSIAIRSPHEVIIVNKRALEIMKVISNLTYTDKSVVEGLFLNEREEMDSIDFKPMNSSDILKFCDNVVVCFSMYIE